MIIEVRYGDRVQRMTYDDFERRIREGEVAASTLVRFPLVTGDAFRPAGELELYQALADPEAAAFRRNLSTAGLPLATAILVGVQIRVYLWSWAPGAARWLEDHFTNWTPAVLEEGLVWRVLSYGLLHVDFTHLLFNLLFIAYTGYHLERAMGWRNLLVLFFGSVVTGGLMSLLLSPGLPTLGSSGGGFGLLAASVVFGWKHWESIPPRARKYFGFAILPYPMISILTSIRAENVDNWCHLGGLLGGVALMTFLEPEVFSARRARNRLVRGATILAGAATLAVLYLYGPRLVALEPVEDTGVTFLRPSGWRPGGAFTGEGGWRSPTGAATLVNTVDLAAVPLSLDEAEAAWLERIERGARAVTVRSREPVQVDGLPGERVTVALSLDDEPFVMDALLVVRGSYTYKVQLLVRADLQDRLDVLVDRVFQGMRIADPPDVAAARQSVSENPRSWAPYLRLAEVLTRAGDLDGALGALDEATRLSPQEPEVLASRLEFIGEHRPERLDQEVKQALDIAPGEPSVVVAAARALAAVDREPEAFELLDRAWAELPGDRLLKRQRKAWGLSTQLP